LRRRTCASTPDGAELLKEVQIERFKLEVQGWSDKRTANTIRGF
jgi:hypothetical protein